MKNSTQKNFTPFIPSEAILAQKEDILLSTALGRVSASLVNLYPPGDILLSIGEVISKNHISMVFDAVSSGNDVLGLTQNEPPMIRVVKRPDYEIIRRNPQTLSRKEIKVYCDLFRETFYNSPYNQLAYANDDWKNPLSASQVIYGRSPSKRDYVDIETIDKFELPDHLSFYMDKDETEKVLTDRFRDEGYLALLYETATGQLKGFCFGRVVTLQRVWETEEFKWPLILAGNKSVVANEALFFSRVKEEFGLTPNSKIMSVSGQAIHPDVRGKDGWFGKLMEATVSQVSLEAARLPMLTEISTHGASRILNASIATKVCEGILENGNPLAYAPTASHTFWIYEGPPSRLNQSIRNQIKKEKNNV